jgi:hypothetical protein
MDDRTQPDAENAPSNRSAPSAPSHDDSHPDGRRTSTGDERTPTDRSSSAKPALTERERRERWPVD